jgi:S-adenosylmethionine synthetase
MVMVDTYGTGPSSDEKPETLVRARIRVTKKEMIDSLGLKLPIDAQTARDEPFGRTDIDLAWVTVI